MKINNSISPLHPTRELLFIALIFLGHHFFLDLLADQCHGNKDFRQLKFRVIQFLSEQY